MSQVRILPRALRKRIASASSTRRERRWARHLSPSPLGPLTRCRGSNRPSPEALEAFRVELRFEMSRSCPCSRTGRRRLRSHSLPPVSEVEDRRPKTKLTIAVLVRIVPSIVAFRVLGSRCSSRGEDAGRTSGAGNKRSSVSAAQLGGIGYLGSRRAEGHHSESPGDGDRLLTRGRIQLGHDRRHMMLCSARRNEQTVGDLGIRHAPRDQVENLRLPLFEVGDAFPCRGRGPSGMFLTPSRRNSRRIRVASGSASRSSRICNAASRAGTSPSANANACSYGRSRYAQASAALSQSPSACIRWAAVNGRRRTANRLGPCDIS